MMFMFIIRSMCLKQYFLCVSYLLLQSNIANFLADKKKCTLLYGWWCEISKKEKIGAINWTLHECLRMIVEEEKEEEKNKFSVNPTD